MDEEEEMQKATDRPYWEEQGDEISFSMVDDLRAILKNVDPELSERYLESYIAWKNNGINFAVLRPRKGWLRLSIVANQSEEIEPRIKKAGLRFLNYNERRRTYRVYLTNEDVKKHEALLTGLLKYAYAQWPP